MESCILVIHLLQKDYAIPIDKDPISQPFSKIYFDTSVCKDYNTPHDLVSIYLNKVAKGISYIS